MSSNINIFPMIGQTFENFHHSKTIPNVLGNKKLVNSMRQAPNLERILCKSKYISAEKHFQVPSCGKYCVCFFPKKKLSFNWKRRNLVYIATCQGCKEEYTG